MIKGLPLTSLIVLNTLCPCRAPNKIFNGRGMCCKDSIMCPDCCMCHLLTKKRNGEVGLDCDWWGHAIINGHAQWEQDVIRLLRECLSASMPAENRKAIYSFEEMERLGAMPAVLREFLGEDE